MLQMIYISTAARGLPATAIDTILAVSRRNNGAVGVTGLLLYDGRRFLQALEGEVAAVEATYARIKADPRHRAAVILSRKDVAARSFGDWAMAAEKAVAGNGATIAEQVDGLTAHLADANLRETFRSFARLRAAA